MANTILTPTAVTRACLEVLHQNLNFVGNINRQYDDSYAVEGAKIGSALKIRLPNQYITATGATLSINDTTETSTTLNVTTQRQVGMRFTANELTLSLQDFTMRIVEPAMKVLAANIEADALTMCRDVYNAVDLTGTSITMAGILLARKRLNDSLAPMDGNRCALLNTQDSADLVNSLKGLFQSASDIKEQYREGMMGRTGGFDFYENTLIPTDTSGTTSATNTWVNSSAIANNISSLDITGSVPGTWAQGDVFTMGTIAAGVVRIHPETKLSTAALQQFVVTTAVTTAVTVTSISFSPSIFTTVTDGRNNVTLTGATSGLALVKIGNTGQAYRNSMVFHRDAFTFATADLIMPQGVHFAGRENQEGISMRIVKQYDINYDFIPCRVDVLYGYKTIRPQLAARILTN